jgi:hypothetical protein
LKQDPEVNKLVKHFFRHEAARVVAVLTKIFGGENLDLATNLNKSKLFRVLPETSASVADTEPIIRSGIIAAYRFG